MMGGLQKWSWLFLFFQVSACAYDFSFEGKQCDFEHRLCPSGYYCVPSDGGSFCRLSPANEFDEQREEVSPGDNNRESWDAGESTEDAIGDPGGTDPEPEHCTEPDQKRCNLQADAIQTCSPDTLNWKDTPCPPQSYCNSESVSCLPTCTKETECLSVPSTSCDKGNGRCEYVDLCAADLPCGNDEDGKCVNGACVKPPQLPCDPGGIIFDFSCYQIPPQTPIEDPKVCNLQGRVVEFTGKETPNTIGLKVLVYSLENILALAGPENLLAETIAFDDGGNGQYSLNSIPTNTELVVLVAGREGLPADPNKDFIDSYSFGIYLRADECSDSGGTISLAVPAFYKVNYPSYTEVGDLKSDPQKGLLIGQLRDCAGNKVCHGTAGLSMPHALLYYLSGLIPDLELVDTGSQGFFVASNVSAIQGMVSALSLCNNCEPLLRSLGSYHIRIFPKSVSIIVFQQPKDPEMPWY